jgi:Trefoil (P-type) domain
MTFLIERLNSGDCTLLFSSAKKKTAELENGEKPENQTSSSTRFVLYGIITCLGLLILLLGTAITAPYFTSFSFTDPQEQSAAEIASDEIIIYELEKLTEELYERAEILQEEIRELENGKTKIPAVPDDALCYLVPNEQRFDCFPEGDASQTTCEARGCCWSAPSTQVREESVCPTMLRSHFFCPFPGWKEKK